MSKKLVALGSFVLLGLSPSFEDWQQSPEKHGQFLAFYAVTVAGFWYGLLS